MEASIERVSGSCFRLDEDPRDVNADFWWLKVKPLATGANNTNKDKSFIMILVDLA